MKEYFLPIIAIISLIAIISVIVFFSIKKNPNDDNCGPNKIKNTCPGKNECIDKCPKFKNFDCKTNTCICNDITKTCGNICCKDGEGCNNNTCRTLCGNDICLENQICQTINTIDGINKKCVDLNKDYFYNSLQFPSRIDNEQPCYQVNTGFCTSDKELSKNECFKNDNEKECIKNKDCNWWDLLQKANTSYINSNFTNLNDLQNEYISASYKQPYGYYCNPDQDNSYHRIIISHENSGNSNDCLKQLGNPSVSNILWDEKNNTCISLQNCNDTELKNCPQNPEHSKYFAFKDDGQIYGQ